MIWVAFLIAAVHRLDGEGVPGLEEIIAVGATRQDAIDLVMDAWHGYAEQHHLDPDSAYPEDVAVLDGAVGNAWINGTRIH